MSSALESLENRCLFSAGDLDPNFGVGGIVSTNFGGAYAYADSVAVQNDGKIVAAGHTYNGSNNDFVVARYNIDGTLDTSFDGDGMLTTDLGTGNDLPGSGNDLLTSIGVQADGKIVVAGYTYDGISHDFALVRYNVDGSFDTSFDGDGILTTDIGTASTDVANSMALQTDGKIVVAGYTSIDNSNATSNFALVRYNNDGTLDTSFDGDGELTTAFGTSGALATSMVLQADGKIVVAGFTYTTSSGSDVDNDFALARYNADGSLDSSFDGDGTLNTDFASTKGFVYSVALQADGKIVVAGYSIDGSETDFALARYNSNGSLDTSFDGDGTLTTDFALWLDYAYSVAVQADGKIVVAGYSAGSGFALTRYNTNGSLDTLFDSDGKLTTSLGVAGGGYATSMALQSDGKIVVAGSSGDSYFGLARYKGIDDASLAITPANASRNEGDSGDTPFTFTITRAGDLSQTASVRYSVAANGPAPANAGDFSGTGFPSGMVTFAAMESVKTITVNVRGDTTVEGDEHFKVMLKNAVNARITTASTIGTILNDDASVSLAATSANTFEGSSSTTPFTFTVTRTGDADEASSVDYVVTRAVTNGANAADFGGSLPHGTVNFAATETSKTITLDVAGDTMIESDEGFTVTLSNPTNAVIGRTASANGTIKNDDSSLAIAAATTNASKSEGSSRSTALTFTITRTGNRHLAATVHFAVTGSGNNAADAADFGGTLPSGTIIFAANRPKATLTINVQGDTTVELDESFTITLSDATNSTLSTATAGGTIKNDDALLSISPAIVSKSEGNSGDTPFTFTVTRTGDLSRASRVTFTVSGNGANSSDMTNAADFGGRFPSGTLNFAVNETTKTIVVNVRGDTTVESHEGFKVTLSRAVNALLDSTASVATAVIQNDDVLIPQLFSTELQNLLDGIDTSG